MERVYLTKLEKKLLRLLAKGKPLEECQYELLRRPPLRHPEAIQYALLDLKSKGFISIEWSDGDTISRVILLPKVYAYLCEFPRLDNPRDPLIAQAMMIGAVFLSFISLVFSLIQLLPSDLGNVLRSLYHLLRQL